MKIADSRVLITGGTGFIGPHLAAELSARDADVIAVDKDPDGSDRLPDDVPFKHADLTDTDAVEATVTDNLDGVFHLAAASDAADPDQRRQYEENTTITYNLLERMNEVGVEHFAFTSTSAVYGEAPRPTPEDYAPLEPISAYAASKLADEGIISVYAHTHGIQSWIFRFANVVGAGQRGNVVPDFVEKLLEDSDHLEILGDGRQEKSYLHVDACVSGLCHIVEAADQQLNVYNLGTKTTTSVTKIADIVSETLGVEPEYEYTGGERGWPGDVPRMRLSIEKARAQGWNPNRSSDDAVAQAATEVLEEMRRTYHD
jgi:UDP-glucose 4-epimerase